MSEVSPPAVGASGPAPPPTTESPKTTISDQEQGKAQQAKDKAGEVAGQAQEKAQEAAGQAKGRAREQIDQRSTQAGEQVSTTAQDLRSVGDTLREQGKDKPAQLADQAADRAEQLGGYLKDADADRILGDVEDFARKQPWAVVAGGLTLGFMAARFMKASSSQRYQQRSSQGSSSPNGLPSGGNINADLPHEGIAPGGQRRFEPGTGGAPQTIPATGVAGGAPAGGVDTPTSGVIPPGR